MKILIDVVYIYTLFLTLVGFVPYLHDSVFEAGTVTIVSEANIGGTIDTLSMTQCQ